MLEVRALLNMVLGAFQNLTTNPSLDALAAYLFTTAAVCIIPALLVSLVTQKDVVSPTFKFWGKWFVAFPLVVFAAVFLYPIHFMARAIEGAANGRWTYHGHFRGNMFAFGANVAAWCIYWPARLVAELTALGIANLPRGTRAAAPAAHGHH